MLNKNLLNVADILDRVKFVLEIKTDKQLADLLNLKIATLTSWKKRNNMNLDAIISLIDLNKIKMDWLLFGRGERSVEKMDSEEDLVILKLKNKTILKIAQLIKEMDANHQEEILNYVKKEKLLKDLTQKTDKKIMYA